MLNVDENISRIQTITPQDIKDEIALQDSYSNVAARMGFGAPNLLQASSYPLTRLTQDYATLTSMYRSNSLVQRICNTIPGDMIQSWFKVGSINNDENQEKVSSSISRSGLRSKLLWGMSIGRLYGGAIGLILVKSQQDLTMPLDIKSILPGDFKGILVFDRWSGVQPSTELVKDIYDPNFGLPMWYNLTKSDGTLIQKVHHSRCLRFIGSKLPHFEEIAELYWGESVIESTYQELMRHDTVSEAIASLIFKANRDVYKIEGINAMMTLTNNTAKKRMWQVLEAQNYLSNSMGLRVIDKDDSVDTLQYKFEGLDKVYNTIVMGLCAATQIPQSKLFGRGTAGLGQSGESDIENYWDYVGQMRENELRPILEKLLPVICMSSLGEYRDEFSVVFNPLRHSSEKDKAIVFEKKIEPLNKLYLSGGISQKLLLKELRDLQEETGVFNNITDEEIEKASDVPIFQGKQTTEIETSVPDDVSTDLTSRQQGTNENTNVNHPTEEEE